MKIFKNKFFLGMVFMSLLLCLIAAKPGGMTQLTSLWIGDPTDTADVTPGENDLFVSGTAEIDGATRIDGALTAAGGMTLTGTGDITATNIADITRSFMLPLAAGGVDGGYDLDEGSTPDLSTSDGIPSVIWADSGETTAVGWTFRLPTDFVSNLAVYALVSSNGASGSGQILDWAVWMNKDATTFDAAPVPQTGVECTSATLNASNEVLTLTSDATAEALYAAGDWITLEFFNASTDDDDLELKGLDVTYTATQ